MEIFKKIFFVILSIGAIFGLSWAVGRLKKENKNLNKKILKKATNTKFERKVQDEIHTISTIADPIEQSRKARALYRSLQNRTDAVHE
jgi:hypothetical protein